MTKRRCREAARDEHQVRDEAGGHEAAGVVPGGEADAARAPTSTSPACRTSQRRQVSHALARPPVAPLPQVDALRRQQQRILHRSALIDYVLAAEKRGGET